jgi:hypothetical protein
LGSLPHLLSFELGNSESIGICPNWL